MCCPKNEKKKVNKEWILKVRIYRETLRDAGLTHAKVTNENDFVNTSKENATVRNEKQKSEIFAKVQKQVQKHKAYFLLSHVSRRRLGGSAKERREDDDKKTIIQETSLEVTR